MRTHTTMLRLVVATLLIAPFAVAQEGTPATSSLAEAVATEVSALRHGLSVAAIGRR